MNSKANGDVRAWRYNKGKIRRKKTSLRNFRPVAEYQAEEEKHVLGENAVFGYILNVNSGNGRENTEERA